LLRAQAITPKNLKLDVYVPQTEFLVMLLSLFAPSPERDRVNKIVATLVWEEGVTASDNGRSQTVTARKGLVAPGKQDTPEIVHLRPFQTFPNIDQPSVPFLLRLDGERHSAMLTACDGGLWQNTAIESIKAFLTPELTTDAGPIACYG
jgi:hypothetical protein